MTKEDGGFKTYKDVLGVLCLGSSDDSGGDHQLFPGLGQVEVVDTILVALVDVGFHLLGHVLSTNVDLNQSYNLLKSGNASAAGKFLTSAAIMLTRSCSLFLV